MKIQNYILGNWEDGEGVELELHSAITGENFGSVSSAGLDYASILEYGREKGGYALANKFPIPPSISIQESTFVAPVTALNE